MNLLDKDSLKDLQTAKPLLAFSAGADSTALFFTLLEHQISFDIAIVHYGLRAQADEEVAYAKELAKKYKLTCHLLQANQITSNFEAEARRVRYEYFESLVTEHAYTHLLTAHHLQDRLEWMLMQLCKGAGSAELLGMKTQELREGHILRRPLLGHSKDEILSYLEKEGHVWFHDESNDDLSYKRNYFRHEIASKLIKDYAPGIKQSFSYLTDDVKELIKETQIHHSEELSIFASSSSKRSDIFHIDKILKTKGYILTASQREELKSKTEVIAGRKFIIVLHQGMYYIAPYLTQTMDKEFKEECRKLSIPSKLRPYLFKEPLAFILYTRFIPCDL